MKGEAQVIERLNEALFLELGAVNQYWVHYRLLNDWGVGKNELNDHARMMAAARAIDDEEEHWARAVLLGGEGHRAIDRGGIGHVGS